MKPPCPGKVGALKQACAGEDMHVGPCFVFDRERELAGDLPERLESVMDLMFEPLLELANEQLRQQQEEASLYWHGKPACVVYDTSAVAAMYNDFTSDDPLPKPSTGADWSWKDRAIEWVLKNFTDGMLAKLYKLLRDGRDFRTKNLDKMISEG